MSLGTSIFLSAILLGIIALFMATKDRWSWKKIVLWPVAAFLSLAVVTGVGFWIYIAISERPQAQTTFWDIPLAATKSDVKFLKGKPTNTQGPPINAEFEQELARLRNQNRIRQLVTKFDTLKQAKLAPEPPSTVMFTRAELEAEFARRKQIEAMVVMSPEAPRLKPAETDDENTWAYVSKKSYSNESIVHVVYFKDNKLRAVLYSGPLWDSPGIQSLDIGASQEAITEKYGIPSYISVSEDDLEKILSYQEYNVFFSLRENKVQAFGMFNPEFEPLKFKKEKKIEAKKP